VAEAFPHLFAPLALGQRTLKNRLVFGAHTANIADGGLPGERHSATTWRGRGAVPP
jgi:2,4-dienoyl-CoA reductase-like NADH-dependent reductase (Old Yellow Enzyme family)